MTRFPYRIFLLWILPNFLYGQFIIDSPKTRLVIQRDVANRAQLIIAGTAPSSASTVEARLIPMTLGQGTPINWTFVANVNSDKTFKGTLSALGGWYRVEIRAKTATTIVADTAINRVGVGEVFVIAGQSNAAGGIVTDVPAATDDRVSCVDLFQRDPIDPQLFPFMFSHVSAGANIGPTDSPYLWGILGDSLTKRLNVPVLFLGAAQIGSNSGEWKASAGATPAVLPYQRVSATLLFYIKRLGVRAVLWHQGESDPSTTESSYFDNLIFIINKSRQQLNHSSLAWLVSRASYIQGSTNSQVIAAQNRLSNEAAEVYAGPATDGLTGPDNRVDDIHFGGQGLLRVANLWNQSLTNVFFSASKPFIPRADTVQTDAGWQPVLTGTPFKSLQRVGYRYDSPAHNFFLLIGATAPVEGRLERLDGGNFTDTDWAVLPPTIASSYNNPGFSDYTFLRFYAPQAPGVGGVEPGRYRLSVRRVGDMGSGYQFETILHDFRNTLFVGNESAPTPPVIQQADLSIAMQTDRRVVSVGQPVTHQLKVTNKGPQLATGLRLQSWLPAGLTYTDSAKAAITALNGLVTIAIDSLLPNKSRVVNLRTIVTASGQYAVAAQLAATNQFDPNSQPGTGTADGEDDMAIASFRTGDSDSSRHESPNPGGRILPATRLNQPVPDSAKADLSLALYASREVAAPGTSLTVICAVSNAGGRDATTITVDVDIPTDWQLLNSKGFSLSGKTIVGTLDKIAAGTTSQIWFVVKVGSTTTNAQLTAQISHADQTDPDSTPGNGYGHGEDDEAVANLRVL